MALAATGEQGRQVATVLSVINGNGLIEREKTER